MQHDLKSNFGISLSIGRIRCWLHRWGFTWRRMRRSVKKQRDEKLFQEFKKEIAQLIDLEATEQIDLFSYDESSFNLNPSPVNCWLTKNSQTTLPAKRGQSLTVAAFLSRDNTIEAFSCNGAMDSQSFIAFTEEFVKTIKKKTIVVLDNVPFHKSKAVMSKIEQWQNKNLFFKFLPPYSPELNWIEILWKRMKYTWLKPKDYSSLEILTQAVENIIKNLGALYQINYE